MNEVTLKVLGVAAVLIYAKSIDRFVLKDLFGIRQLWLRIPLFILIADSHIPLTENRLYLICFCVMAIGMSVIPLRAKELFIERKEKQWESE